jgi:Pirin C-terminal cupin domain
MTGCTYPVRRVPAADPAPGASTEACEAREVPGACRRPATARFPPVLTATMLHRCGQDDNDEASLLFPQGTFGERMLMWWNFVARSGAEIKQARADWIAGRFGEVRGYSGEPLVAPPLPDVPLKPR